MIKLLLSFLFLLILSSCSLQWNYKNQDNWGAKDENRFCKIGYNQSPIDVKYEFKENDLKFSYQKSNVEKKRVNYVLKSEFFSRDFLQRGKKKYFIRYLEFHHPSEHLVKGEPRSIEMQIIHKSEDEQWLVLAIFLEVGEENAQFSQIINFLQSSKKEGEINLGKIVNSDDKIFFYDGSFTTPPCFEGVKWYVMQTPIYLSKEQMNQIIKSAIFAKSNARKVQEFHPEKF
jgi:carbonic anhydrase